MQATTARFIVSGRVQGVYFRAWTREQAEGLGLSGWVRNRPDGTVEVLAQGDPQTLQRFESLLHEGPTAARVSAVERAEADEPPEHEGFHVRH
jgi:acylphosphatase